MINKLFKIKKTQNVRIMQMIRYIFVGGSAFLVEYAVFSLLIIYMSGGVINLFFVQTTSFICGLFVSFFGNKSYTFRQSIHQTHAHTIGRQSIMYASLALCNLVVTNILLAILVKQLGIPALVAKVCVMVAVAVWNFLLFKKVIFRSTA